MSGRTAAAIQTLIILRSEVYSNYKSTYLYLIMQMNVNKIIHPSRVTSPHPSLLLLAHQLGYMHQTNL